MASSASRLAVWRADGSGPRRRRRWLANPRWRRQLPGTWCRWRGKRVHSPKGPLNWTLLGVRSPPSAGEVAARPTGCSAGGTRRGNSTIPMSPQVDASFRGSAPLPYGVVSPRVTSSIGPVPAQRRAACEPDEDAGALRIASRVADFGLPSPALPIQESGVNRDGVFRFLGLPFIRCASLAAFSYTRTGGLAT